MIMNAKVWKNALFSSENDHIFGMEWTFFTSYKSYYPTRAVSGFGNILLGKYRYVQKQKFTR